MNITDRVESVLYRKEIISPSFSFFGEFPFFNRPYSSRLLVVLAITFFGAFHYISLSDNPYDGLGLYGVRGGSRGPKSKGPGSQLRY